MLPLRLRPIDDINVRSWLGSTRNRGHKVCFERVAVVDWKWIVGEAKAKEADSIKLDTKVLGLKTEASCSDQFEL